MTGPAWLKVLQGAAPLVVSLPHTGADLVHCEPRFVSPWLARKDTDWWLDQLYDFAGDLGATVIHTSVSRSVIDVNRDPSGVSLYPGQATTELCPISTFDGEPLYRDGQAPDAAEIAARRAAYFDPYHTALRAEIDRLRARHGAVALYDCHSIRSVIPRLFDGELPIFNIGTNSGASAGGAPVEAILDAVKADGRNFVVNGRFKGGWITRSFGAPARGVHAIQMELACRAYMREPIGPLGAADWPVAFDEKFAAPTRLLLRRIFTALLSATRAHAQSAATEQRAGPERTPITS